VTCTSTNNSSPVAGRLLLRHADDAFDMLLCSAAFGSRRCMVSSPPCCCQDFDPFWTGIFFVCFSTKENSDHFWIPCAAGSSLQERVASICSVGIAQIIIDLGCYEKRKDLLPAAFCPRSTRQQVVSSKRMSKH
jgi:hypothetical protein